MTHIRYRMTKFIDFLWAGALAMWIDLMAPFLIPIQWYLVFMIAAIIFDTITGIMAARKEKRTITSSGIWRTIEKILIAFMVILLSEGFRRLWIPMIPLTQGVSAIIAAAEVLSVYENYRRITGVDILTKLRDKLNSRSPQNPISDENK